MIIDVNSVVGYRRYWFVTFMRIRLNVLFAIARALKDWCQFLMVSSLKLKLQEQRVVVGQSAVKRHPVLLMKSVTGDN